jgi:hypothetical protein
MGSSILIESVIKDGDNPPLYKALDFGTHEELSKIPKEDLKKQIYTISENFAVGIRLTLEEVLKLEE